MSNTGLVSISLAKKPWSILAIYRGFKAAQSLLGCARVLTTSGCVGRAGEVVDVGEVKVDKVVEADLGKDRAETVPTEDEDELRL